MSNKRTQSQGTEYPISLRRLKAFALSAVRAVLSGEENELRLRRIRLVGTLGVVGHPLYYFIWTEVFPLPYDSGWLRAICTLLFLPFLFPQRLSQSRWFACYPFIAITVGFPFCFVFLYLKNAGTAVWAESLLIAVVILFHFSTAFAVTSLTIGAIGAVLFFEWMEGPLAMLSWHAVPIHLPLPAQIPILAFEVATLAIIKLDRQALAEQKQRGAEAALGIVAHELRTPLASVELTMRGVLARVQRALVPDCPPEFHELPKAIERVRFEVNRMNNTIELLVVNSRDPKSIELTLFDPHEVICSIIAAYPFEGRLSDVVHIGPSPGAWVKGNAALFGHVVTNLTKNALEAIRRARKGELTVTCQIVGAAVEIRFRDTGSGIPTAILSRLFQPFFSYPAHRGTGIGLAFCRKVLHSWGGAILCQSVEHEYTEFKIQLPHYAGTGFSDAAPNLA